MIPKKGRMSSDPTQYRPISLLSCIGKLVERVARTRLVKFLEANNLIIKQQSGFRHRRSTTDNLLFVTQKIRECFERDKSCMQIQFDIKAAYDSVWHEGLKYKLRVMNVPFYLLAWFDNFLTGRVFVVRVNGVLSVRRIICRGVPQGAVSSPNLFAVFINDIPVVEKQNSQDSVLYADDLASLFVIDRRLKVVKKEVQKHLGEIEAWLTRWHMKMATHKCCYTVFSRKRDIDRRQFEGWVSLFGQPIPYEANPFFLGINFDEKLNFEHHVKCVRKACVSRLNVLKIISHRSWRLNPSVLKAVYSSLVRSKLDYMAFAGGVLSKKASKGLEVVQNTALRIIYKVDWRTRTKVSDVLALAEVPTIAERLSGLFEKYLSKGLQNGNPLIVPLARSFMRGFQSKAEHVTPLSLYINTINEAFEAETADAIAADNFANATQQSTTTSP
jgi:hypothetical protein